MKNSLMLADRLQQCYSGAVYDVLRSMGYADQVLPHDILPLDRDQKLAGEIYTVEGRMEEGLDAHQSLLQWCRLLSESPPGAVLICQPNDTILAHMGELSAETLKLKGVRGYIVDGGCRDTAFIEAIGFPVFCKYYTPADIVGRWAPVASGKPVNIGGVVIHPGDYVMADRDGIVIIPNGTVEETINRTEEILRTESLVRKAILQGVDPVDAYLKYGKF